MPAVTFPTGISSQLSFAPENWRTQRLSEKIFSRRVHTSAQPSSRIDSSPKTPLAMQEPRTPTSIPLDSKAVIDVEYVPMPHRSGAEAQQRLHFLDSHPLVGVWNAADRPFEALEARMATRMPAPWKYVAGPRFHGAGMHSAEKEATQKKNQRAAKPLSRRCRERCQKLYECVKVLTWLISTTYTTSQLTGTG